MDFTIGTDVELFAKKGKKFVSSIPFIGSFDTGTKHNPIKFKGGHTLQRDNVATEFATKVANNDKEFVRNIRVALKEAVNYVPKGTELQAISSVIFDNDELSHPEAFEFGCDPDFNAWNDGDINPRPCAANMNLRTAAAHIHIGHPFLKGMKNKIRMIKMMDCYCGMMSVILDSSPESLRRKELYGKAGAFRPTSYGVEYRTLSNFWIKSPEIVSTIYFLTHNALKSLYQNQDKKIISTMGGKDEITGIINSGNVKLAEKLLDVKQKDFTTGYASLKKEWKL